MPNELSFLGRHAPAFGTTQDPGATKVDELLASLELAPRSAPISTGRRILGTIGDALLAAASVRAGEAPPSTGPFSARLRIQQQIDAAAEEANRNLRNRIRFAQFQAEQEAETAAKKEPESVAPFFRPESQVVVDEDGNLFTAFTRLDKRGNIEETFFQPFPGSPSQPRGDTRLVTKPFQIEKIGEKLVPIDTLTAKAEPDVTRKETGEPVVVPPRGEIAGTLTAQQNVLRQVDKTRQLVTFVGRNRGPMERVLAQIAVGAGPLGRAALDELAPDLGALADALVNLARSIEQADIRARVGEARFGRIQRTAGEVARNPRAILRLLDKIEIDMNFLQSTLAETAGHPSAVKKESRSLQEMKRRRNELKQKQNN